MRGGGKWSDTQTVDNMVSRGRFPWRFPNERIENEDTKESLDDDVPALSIRSARDDRFETTNII